MWLSGVSFTTAEFTWVRRKAAIVCLFVCLFVCSWKASKLRVKREQRMITGYMWMVFIPVVTSRVKYQASLYESWSDSFIWCMTGVGWELNDDKVLERERVMWAEKWRICFCAVYILWQSWTLDTLLFALISIAQQCKTDAFHVYKYRTTPKHLVPHLHPTVANRQSAGTMHTQSQI